MSQWESSFPASVPVSPIPQPSRELGGIPSSVSCGAPTGSLTGKEKTPANGQSPTLVSRPIAVSLLHALRRRWLTALLVALLGSLAAVVGVTAIISTPYLATAIVYVNPPNPNHPLFEGQGDFQVFRKTQQGIVKYPEVIKQALNRPEIAVLSDVKAQTDAVSWLQKKIQTDYKQGPTLLSIHVSGDNAQTVHLLANAVAEEFEQFHREDVKQKVELRTNQLNQELDNVLEELAKLRRNLNAEYNKRGIPTEEMTQTNYKSSQEVLLQLKKEKEDRESQKITIRSTLERKEKQLIQLPKETISEKQIALLLTEPGFQYFANDLDEIDQRIQQYQATYPAAVAQQHVAKELARRDKLLQSLKELHLLRKRGKLKSEIENLKRELADLRSSLEGKEQIIQSWENKVKQLSLPVLLPAELEKIKAQIQLNENRLKDICQEKAKLRKAFSGGMGVRLQSRANIPQSVDSSRRIQFAGGAFLGMFGFLVFAVAFWESRSRKISTSSDVVKGLSMNLIGTLPRLPPQARQPLSQSLPHKDLHWQNLMTESMDTVRTILLHMARTENPKTLLVTSAMKGEGKTSVASQLAASLARAWKKTLLIDANRHNPAIHRLFNQSLEPGFAEVLRGEADFKEATQPTLTSRLWMLSGGQWDNHAVQALAQEGLCSLFDQLKKWYDFIIIDSCPVLPVADTLLLGQHVDAVILSVLRDVSRAPLIHNTQQRLTNLGIHPLGAVMIGSRGESYCVPVGRTNDNPN